MFLAEEAEAFKHRMETEEGFLAKLTGLFSTHAKRPTPPLLEATEENRNAFRM